MRFELQNRSIDTLSMAGFATGVPWMPFIYVDANRECFLEQRRKSWDGPRAKLISRLEALRFADVFHIAGLREVLSYAAPKEKRNSSLVTELTQLKNRILQGHERPDAPDETGTQRMLNCIEDLSLTETRKSRAGRWLHPFASAVAS